MSFDLQLKPSCDGCGSNSDLYGSTCKHLTLCLKCGRSRAESRAKCFTCGVPITKLIREYSVRASTATEKSYFIGRFITGLPPFSKKKSAENKWTIQKEGLQGRQITDALKEKYKNRPWILEDETGQHQFHGHMEGAQSATYYLLMMHGKEFVAIPAGSWYNFNKIAQYKQLTLEEAEEKMSKRRSNAQGYERWLMKAATNGPAAFGEAKKNEAQNEGPVDKTESSRSRKGKSGEDVNLSDRGEEDQEEEEARKSRLGFNKGVEDDEEVGKEDFDLDDDDIEKGDDWEHEDIFTDDDEAVGHDPEERDEMDPDIPAPPEIKQDDDESEEEGGLSKSGKELKKLLGKAAGLSESDAEDDDDDDEMDDEASPVLAPKQKVAPKDEPTDNSPSKATPTASTKGQPEKAKSSKAKRKSGNDESKSERSTPAKKVKSENESKPSTVKEEPSASKSSTSAKPSVSVPSKTGSSSSAGPVTVDEIRNVLLSMAPMKTQDLVDIFKPRLKSKEEKNYFAEILKKISKIQKTNGQSFVVLREK